jgi:hypothetical protein
MVTPQTANLVGTTTVFGNQAPFGTDLATAPITLSVQFDPWLHGTDPSCRGPLHGVPVLLQIPSGCAVLVKATMLDAYGRSTVTPTLTQPSVGGGPACIGGNACLSGLASQPYMPDGVFFTVTVSGPLGSTFCVTLATDQPALATAPFTGVVANCSAGAAAPAIGTCDGCRACGGGQFDLSGSGICTSCAFTSPTCDGCAPDRVRCAGAVVRAQAGSFPLFDPVTGGVLVVPCAAGMCDDPCPAGADETNCTASLLARWPRPYQCVDNVTDGMSTVSGYCQLHVACAPGREGFLCGTCAPGYSEWDGSCVGVSARLVLFFCICH